MAGSNLLLKRVGSIHQAVFAGWWRDRRQPLPTNALPSNSPSAFLAELFFLSWAVGWRWIGGLVSHIVPLPSSPSTPKL